MTLNPQFIYVEKLVNDLGVLFEKSSAAYRRKASETSKPITSKLIDSSLANVFHTDCCDCVKPKLNKHEYSGLTEEKKEKIESAKRWFHKCLLKEDEELPEVHAIMNPTVDQKLPFPYCFGNHSVYVTKEGFPMGFIMLMRLIFDLLLNPLATIGIPNEYMHFFMKSNRELFAAYETYNQMLDDPGVLCKDYYHKQLIYIQYYLNVLSFMITVKIGK